LAIKGQSAAIAAAAAETISSNPPPGAVSSGPAGSAKQRSIEDLIALAARRKLMPSQVHPFDEATEADLIRLYRAAKSPVERQNLVCVMAYGGGASTVALFTNVLLGEFAGRPLDAWNLSLVNSLPMHLGILARREHMALQFLLAGVEGRLDLRQSAWESGEYKLGEKALRGRFWTGLGYSGRSEAQRLLQQARDGTDKLLTENAVLSTGTDAAFCFYIVSSRGLDEMVRLSYDLDESLREFGVWKRGTEDGRAWDAWFHEHSPLVNPAYRKSRSKAE
jgi:hypothetical protein